MVSATTSSQNPDASRFEPFEACDYYDEYYPGLIQDEKLCLGFLVEAIQRFSPVPLALDFASGPVVSHLVALASRASELHAADFLVSNRAEIERWAAGDEAAKNWNEFTSEILRLETGKAPSLDAVWARERQTRERLRRVLPCDITQSAPLGDGRCRSYPLVTAHYCAEALGAPQEAWRGYMRNLLSLVEPGGGFITTVCGSTSADRDGDFFRFKGERQALTMVTPEDLLAVLRDNGFVEIDLRVRKLETAAGQGYDCLILASAMARG